MADNSIPLVLPFLLGKEETPLNNVFVLNDEEPLLKFDNSQNKLLEKIEESLGRYVKYLKNEILDYFFPDEALVEEWANYLLKGNKKTLHILPLPLYVVPRLAQKLESISERGSYFDNAWANLMLELGIFSLDEKSSFFNPSFYYKFNDEYYILNALIRNPDGKIMDEIWKRIVGEKKKANLIFVDDDNKFREKWHLPDNENNKLVDLICPKAISKDKNKENNEYTLEGLQETIENKLSDENASLNILIIDLMFKKKKDNNSEVKAIIGDVLIRNLRQRRKKIFIIAFTGGDSPFIINSAEKNGADIVVFKARGLNDKFISGHTPIGTEKGVFDLLWAISWNITVYRFFEYYKEIIEKNTKQFIYEPLPEYFFSNLENVTPFWKSYLKDWITNVDDIRIKKIFEGDGE